MRPISISCAGLLLRGERRAGTDVYAYGGGVREGARARLRVRNVHLNVHGHPGPPTIQTRER
jgi:hypothetical protein